MHEPGINLENQVCHWIEGMKSPENDIKIIGIGATVWKWQAFYETNRSAIYSKQAPKCYEKNMLQPPNMKTKMHDRDAHKLLNKSLGLSHRQIHPLRGSNKHGKTE